jgi:hypothetical protein
MSIPVEKLDTLAHYFELISRASWSPDSDEMAEMFWIQHQVFHGTQAVLGDRRAHEESLKAVLRYVLEN